MATGAVNSPAKDHQKHSRQDALQIASKRSGSIVIDAFSGEVLLESHADRLLSPAPMTKLMTLYKTFQALESGFLRLDQPVGISIHAANQPPVHIGLSAET